MKRFLRRIISVGLALVMLLGLSLSVSASAPVTEPLTILFTHDLHSHLLPASDGNGGTYGGYAGLATLIRQQKAQYPDALLLDGGDFSMGSLFQTAYTTSALELRIMGAMGYDVTTFGNHEFDYLPAGLISMLNTAAACGEKVPAIVDANYLPPKAGEAGSSEESQAFWAALENYGVAPYTILKKGGVYFAVFGIFGLDSDDCAPNSGMVFADPAEVARETVAAARAECLETYGVEPLVVCLSHSGTTDDQGEDYELAKNVPEIDVIISGHSHTELASPIVVGDTYIVSAGEYAKNLGVMQMEFDGTKAVLTDYALLPVDETTPQDPEIAAMIETFKSDVEANYLHSYGVTFDQVLTYNPYTFDTVDEVYATPHESTLGNIFSDAYKKAAEDATGETIDFALTASGVIRESLPVGNVTVSDVFNAASLGVGTEGELIRVYLTGRDLKNALEVDASVQPLMSAAQLFCAGVEYSFNTSRMIFNKVDYAMLRRNDGTLEEIDDEKLYSVVVGMYVGQMLGSVEETSFGLLAITPRDEGGNPIPPEELVNFVIHDEAGVPVKEWYAIASYLMSMGGQVDSHYAATDGRKVVYSSLNPVKLLQNPNKFTYIALAVILLLLALLLWVTVRIIKKRKK